MATARTPLFNKLINLSQLIAAGSQENRILVELNHIVNQYGEQNFKEVEPTMRHDNSRVSMLHFCARNNYLQVAKKLIELGVDIDDGITCDNKNDMAHHKSPLIAACEKSHIAMVQLLLDQNANLLKTTATNTSVLMYVSSIDVLQLLIDTAIDRDQLKELLGIITVERVSAFDYACIQGNPNVAKKLLEVLISTNSHFNVHDALNSARTGYFHYPDEASTFEEICLTLRQSIGDRDNVYQFDAMKTSFSDAYEKFFGNSHQALDAEKIAHIKNMLIEVHLLLNDINQCFQYFEFLNLELIRFSREILNKEFPTLDERTYEFRVIDHLLFPIPNDNFVGIQKESILQRLLISIFKKYDLAPHCSKWIGGVLEEESNAMIVNGEFFMESRIGVGLFHGKLSHMLQWLLVIYAIESKRIPLNQSLVSVKEFIGSFVTTMDKTNVPVWLDLLDHRHDTVTFGDPYRLSSLIMTRNKELKALSDALIDTFCNGYLQLTKACSKQTPKIKITNKEYVEKFNDLDPRLFSLPSPLMLQYAIQRDKLKGHFVNDASNDDYAIVAKSYPEDHFKSKRFGG